MKEHCQPVSTQCTAAAVLLGVLFLSAARCPAGGEGSHRVVALVNREVITSGDVMDRAASRIAALDPETPLGERQDASEEILNETLQLIIEEHLLVAEGERVLKLNAGLAKRIDKSVSEQLEKERLAAGGAVAFREALAQKGLRYADYVKRVRLRMVRDLVLYRYVVSDISVSPDELLDFYRKNLDRFREPAQVKYRQIFVRNRKYESRDKAQEMAEYLIGLLRKQHDFAKLAVEYSDGPHAADGGLWDFTRRGVRPKPIDDLLFSLPVAEVGGPVETEIGFTILKLVERTSARTVPFEEAQQKIAPVLQAKKRNDRYAELIGRLKAGNYVEVLEAGEQ